MFQTLANVRNAYWDLVFAQSAVDVAQRATELADKLVEDNQARVEVGTLAPLDIVQAQAEAATRRQNLAAAEATAQTAELSLKRYIVSGTDDPMWRQTLRPVDLPIARPAPTDIDGAVRTRARASAPTSPPRGRTSIQATSTCCVSSRTSRMPALDLNASYGAQGLGGTALAAHRLRRRQRRSTGTIPGGYSDALSALARSRLPDLELQRER